MLFKYKQTNISTVIFLIISNVVFSQNSSFKVIYSINYDANNKASTNAKTAKLVDKINKSSNELTFILLHSEENKTSFTVSEKLNNEISEEDKLAKRVSLIKICPYDYYFDFDNQKSILKTVDGVLIENKTIKFEWKLINETKIIDGFKCFKAITFKKIKNYKKEVKDIEITAWYAPSIPISVGPKEYNGLPGLILEIQESRFTLYASSVTLSDKKIEINFPSGKAITQEEYEKKALSGY
jgi:GLPGLI family protein